MAGWNLTGNAVSAEFDGSDEQERQELSVSQAAVTPAAHLCLPNAQDVLEAPREQGDNGRVLDLPKSSNTMEYELTDFITAIDGIDNVKEEIWETPAGRHELGHYRDVTLVSLRIMDAVRQQAGITFPADAGKQA